MKAPRTPRWGRPLPPSTAYVEHVALVPTPRRWCVRGPGLNNASTTLPPRAPSDPVSPTAPRTPHPHHTPIHGTRSCPATDGNPAVRLSTTCRYSTTTAVT